MCFTIMIVAFTILPVVKHTNADTPDHIFSLSTQYIRTLAGSERIDFQLIEML